MKSSPASVSVEWAKCIERAIRSDVALRVRVGRRRIDQPVDHRLRRCGAFEKHTLGRAVEGTHHVHVHDRVNPGTLGRRQRVVTAMVVLIRHAERQPAGSDPRLSPAGKRRARLLVTMLDGAGVTAIFTSGFKRTKETAAPLAAKLAITVHPIDEDTAKAKAQILGAGACVLVVGHSDTVPAFIAALGGPAVTIEDDEFDRMFVLNPATPGAAATLLSLRYVSA